MIEEEGIVLTSGKDHSACTDPIETTVKISKRASKVYKSRMIIYVVPSP